MATWQGRPEPVFEPLRLIETCRFTGRLLFFVAALIVLLPLFWIMRLLELPFGTRALSNFVIWLTCRMGVMVCGLSLETVGTPMPQGGAWVSNHCSWLEIFVLRAAGQMFFVAKAEVRSWPVLGFIADQTGTMFIERKRTEAKRQEAMFAERLHRGDRLCFFPEGTSSDGLRVLPFKSTLFNAFMTEALIDEMWVQPVTVFYESPAGELDCFYGWYGEIDFAAHLKYVLAKSRGGRAKVIFQDAVRARDFTDRKALSKHCETVIAAAHLGEMDRLGLVAPPEISAD